MPVLAPTPHQRPDGRAMVATDEQRSVLDFAHSDDPICLVQGGPGSGKTTTLLSSVVQRVGDGLALQRMLVIAGSRSAAQQLRAQLVNEIGRTQLRPNVMTIHGLAQAILQRSNPPGVDLPGLLTAPDQDARLRELLSAWPLERWPVSVRLASQTRGFASQLRALLARARQLGLDPADLQAIGESNRRPEIAVAGQFFAEYLDVLDAAGVLDYAELVHRARLALHDSSNWQCGASWQTIYVDEFAELDPSQVGLLADLVAAGPGLVAFSDPTTSVFGFRGADAASFQDFADIFGSIRPTGQPELLTLSRQLRAIGSPSYRTLAGVNAAIARRLGVPSEFETVAPSDQVEVLVLPNDQLAGEQIADRLRRAHAAGLDWEQMAVICRAGHSSLAQLATRLRGLAIPVQVWADQVALRAEPAVRALLDVLAAVDLIAEQQPIPVTLAQRILRSPMAGAEALDLRELGRQLRHMARIETAASQPEHDSNMVLPSADELIATELVMAKYVPPSAVEDQDMLPAMRVLARLRSLLHDLSQRLADGAAPADLLWRAWDGTQWPQQLQAQALGGGEGSDRANRDLDAVIALFDLADRHAGMVGQKGLRTFIEQVSAQQIAADTSRESNRVGAGVALLTTHRAKGKQWPLVVVTGAQEGQWPRTGVAPQLLAADQLGAQGLLMPQTSAQLIAADRRAFLLAISRATQSLLVVANSGEDGEDSRPSRFLYEMGLPVLDADRADLPAAMPTMESLVAQLRRTAADASNSPALRREAAQLLADLAAERDSKGRVLVPAADPRSWWGLDDYSAADAPVARADEPVRLTGSELEAILTCPRSWFLARRAKAEQSGTTAASLGTIIHTLAQHAMVAGLGLEQLRSAVDDVWAQVPFEAAWLSVSERAEVDAALERLDAWTQLAEDRQVVGVEVPFDITVAVQDGQGDQDRVRLVGAVDRLELTGGNDDSEQRLRIVDYKTGRSEPTAAQAAQSDQLGVYQLAAKMGAFDDLLGEHLPLADAQLVYLRAKAKDGINPKSLVQPSLDERPWPPTETGEAETWVHERLAKAARIVRSEKFDAIANPRCQFCAFKAGCPAIGTKR